MRTPSWNSSCTWLRRLCPLLLQQPLRQSHRVGSVDSEEDVQDLRLLLPRLDPCENFCGFCVIILFCRKQKKLCYFHVACGQKSGKIFLENLRKYFRIVSAVSALFSQYNRFLDCEKTRKRRNWTKIARCASFILISHRNHRKHRKTRLRRTV